MTAYISRELAPDSEFRALLEARGWAVHGQSLVSLSPLPFSAIPACDWIFFSSQNAVRFFFQTLPGKRSDDSRSSEHSKLSEYSRPYGSDDSESSERPKLPEHPKLYWSDDLESSDQIMLPKVKWAALGVATGKALTGYVGKVDFVGNGEPEATAIAFNAALGQALPSGARLSDLFPAARRSRQSVQAFLGDAIQGIQLEVYDNRPLPHPPRRDDDVLAFTSPLNAGAYFSKHALSENQRVVAIGSTTAAALRRLGIAELSVADEPNERSLAEAVLTA